MYKVRIYFNFSNVCFFATKNMKMGLFFLVILTIVCKLTFFQNHIFAG